jgi:hypothetical protein
MKKMLVVSFLLAAALGLGCSKKKPNTTPTETKTEMKQDGGAMGGATYGGATYGGAKYGGAQDPGTAPH